MKGKGSAIYIDEATTICPGCKDFITSSSLTHCNFVGSNVQEEEALIWVFHHGLIHMHDVTVMRRGEERLIPTAKREFSRFFDAIKNTIVNSWCESLVQTRAIFDGDVLEELDDDDSE